MNKWEYKYEGPRTDEHQLDFLNRLGADGWELIQMDLHYGYFKRPKT